MFYEKLTNQYLYKIKSNVEKPLKIIASFTFIISSVIITWIALSGKIIMDDNMLYGKKLQTFIYDMSSRLRNPLLDSLVLILILAFLIILIRKARTENK